jgi:hypothetical protein
VTFTKILTIYHSWTHPTHHSSLSPHSPDLLKVFWYWKSNLLNKWCWDNWTLIWKRMTCVIEAIYKNQLIIDQRPKYKSTKYKALRKLKYTSLHLKSQYFLCISNHDRPINISNLTSFNVFWLQKLFLIIPIFSGTH